MKLLRRAQLLKLMGVLEPGEKTWRAGWSHDDGKYIYFDAWVNRYAKDKALDRLPKINGSTLRQYPMCTDKEYIRPDDSGRVRHIDRTTGKSTKWQKPAKGHTRWLHHLDLCTQGLRKPVLINAVPKKEGIKQNEDGVAGWLPQYSLGEICKGPPWVPDGNDWLPLSGTNDEDLWFHTLEVRTLDYERLNPAHQAGRYFSDEKFPYWADQHELDGQDILNSALFRSEDPSKDFTKNDVLRVPDHANLRNYDSDSLMEPEKFNYKFSYGPFSEAIDGRTVEDALKMRSITVGEISNALDEGSLLLEKAPDALGQQLLENPVEAAKNMIQRHIDESQALLKQLKTNS